MPVVSDNVSANIKITVSKVGKFYFINLDEKIGKAWNRITISRFSEDDEKFAKTKAKNIAKQIGCEYEEIIK